MGDEFEHFADSLRDELLTEMAETFFGTRKEVERVTEILEQNAAELRHKLRTIGAQTQLLLSLVPDASAKEQFFRILDVEAAPFYRAMELLTEDYPQSLPEVFALTPKGRYVKTVKILYRCLQNSINSYMNGTYYTDPHYAARKRITVHYRQIEEMARTLNERIEKVNAYQSPACALDYIRSLDPEEIKRREVTGATLQGYACGIDKRLAMPLFDIEAQGIFALPELPTTDAAVKKLTRYFQNAYKNDPAAASALLINFSDKKPK